MNRIDSIRAIEKIWNAECKNGQLLYWNYNEECWAIKDDLKLLTKYKKAFEVLKEKYKFKLIKNEELDDEDFNKYKLLDRTTNITIGLYKEEYELLEELMKDARTLG